MHGGIVEKVQGIIYIVPRHIIENILYRHGRKKSQEKRSRQYVFHISKHGVFEILDINANHHFIF
jgi:hypothetical protein